MAALTQPFYEDWANLPDLVLIQVFSYLSVVERCRVGATCKHWLQCLEMPKFWTTFKCVFRLPADTLHIKYIKKFGCFISKLTIYIDHTQGNNIYMAIAALKHLSNLKNLQLSYLSIIFKDKSPLCYGGDDFKLALQRLFTKIGEKKCTLKHLNLPCLAVKFKDKLIDDISSTCPNLEYLNISRNSFMFSFSPRRMKILALKCREIQVLHLYYDSLSNDVLKALSKAGRKPLQRLGIVCYRSSLHDLSSEAWSSFLTANPDLKVVLKFEHGCPPHRISKIMKPELPVQELHLTMFNPQISQVINKAVVYYEQMLEKLVVSSNPSRELQESLLDAVLECKKLKALYVHCDLDKDVIDRILELCPQIRDTRNCILKWKK
ncbi:hypothetical protein BsWGS_16303 [Bradybaena similaris]